jgi:spheroidene monooxygenase
MYDQIACFTFFRYSGKNKKWGLGQMFKARGFLDGFPNLVFYKLVGLGGGRGYSLKTSFDSYGIFTVWEDPGHADHFFSSGFFREFLNKSNESFTIIMKPLNSRGSWSGFDKWRFAKSDPDNSLICVLTRATLKVRFIYPFFNMIRKVMKDHHQFPGLLFSNGFSELPFKEQATFSIWENIDQMKKFAYQGFHALAIKITRKRKGFKEDMYTRFQPVATIGTWKSENPLLKKVKNLDNHGSSSVSEIIAEDLLSYAV